MKPEELSNEELISKSEDEIRELIHYSSTRQLIDRFESTLTELSTVKAELERVKGDEYARGIWNAAIKNDTHQRFMASGLAKGLPVVDFETYYASAMQTAMQTAIAEVGKDRWIDESTKKPDENVRVLVCVESLGERITYIAKLKGNLYFKDKGSKSAPMEFVTHWQPLPTAPIAEPLNGKG